MAPYSIFSTLQQTRTERDHIKLRKPVVEKMRRDRINGCIEQLKILLEKELHREGCPKLEKADVLEMTVCFLKQQLGQAPRAPQRMVHGAPQMEVHSATRMEGYRAPHKKVHGAPYKEVHGAPHKEVHGAPHKEVRGTPHNEVRGAPHKEVRGAPHKEVRGAPHKEVHKLPQTEMWLQGSITSPQPRDIVTNSAPVWRPW